MKTIIRLLMVSLAIILSSSVALACSCAFGGGGVCEDYWKAKAVFVGTVIDSKTVTFKRDGYYDQMRLVRFSIDEGFRGVEGAQVEVLTGFGGGDCGFGFAQSKQYLVYAYDYPDGGLATGICTRTKEIEKSAEDFSYIRGLAKAKPGSKIKVEVVRYTRGAHSNLITTPLEGTRVIVVGEEQKKELKTNAKGNVVLEDLPPGNYEVSLSLPKGLMTPEATRKIQVADRGCAFVYFSVETDGRLSGRVLNAAGLPLPNAAIALSEASKEKYRGHSDYASSDENGRYRFRRIPPGRYVLLIRFDGDLTSQHRPFPVYYYPGVTDKSQAQVIAIGEGQVIEQFDLTMPPLPMEYEVVGSVEGLNGEPIRVEYLQAGQYVAYSVPVVEGKFRFKAYEGLRLVLNASQKVSDQKVAQSNWVEVTVVSGLAPVKLVITPRP